MKTLIFKLLIIMPLLLISQHKGNYNQQEISRQNIVQSKKYAGNSIIYNNRPTVINHSPLNPSKHLTIDLKALCNVKASNYTAIFNLVQIGETAEEAQTLIAERVNNVKSTLKSKGISEDNIIIDVISFVPVYEVEIQKKLFSKKYNEVPKGFELQQNIHISFTKAKDFEHILATCAKNEIYNLVKVDYFIKDIHLVYKKLQDELIKLVADKKSYYKILGFDLNNYDVSLADNKYCYFPKDFYRNYQAFNSISFEAIKRKKGVTKVKKQTSYYYQPITYEMFDLVINPSILEPVVQVGMDLKLVYTPKPVDKTKPKEKVVTKHNYYVISPNGDIDIKSLKTE